MGVKEFKYDLFRAGYIHSPSQSTDTENETSVQDWQTLFPEVAQEDIASNSATNNLDEKMENVQKFVKYHSRKRLSTLSDDSLSVDSIDIDHKLLTDHQPSTSNNQHYGKFTSPVITNISSSSSTANLSEQDEFENEYAENTVVTDVTEFSARKPPIPQVMRKEEQKYDPQRIPSSVFERCDSLIPAEWSAASNESLFSLHIGNNSIGRDDQTIALSEELKKHGGVLPKTVGEFANSGELSDLRMLSGLLNKPNDDDQIDEVDDEVKTSNNSRNDVSYAEREEEILKMIAAIQLGEAKRNKQKKVHSSNSTSIHSNTSEDSNYSFAFPVFGEAEKNALARGFLQKQYSPKQDIRSPKLALQALAPSGGNGFFSCCLRIFSCKSCCRCPSCFPSRPSCFGWISRFSCASCKSCC